MKESLVLLNQVCRFSLDRLDKLRDFLSSPGGIFSLSRDKILKSGLFTSEETEKILVLRKRWDLKKEIEEGVKQGIRVLTVFDEEYPGLLKEIDSFPLAFYVRGDVSILNNFCFAIVGSRLATIYGQEVAERFAYRLSNLGVVIISGLARGIDSYAHRGALKGGKTVAVLGSGLLNIYPPENKPLAEKIVTSGVVISEFSLKERPQRYNFPRRNRIISGLSKGVLVVEAAKRSGALITARYALEQNREVFAIPGKAGSPLSQGTHMLIKEGAKLVDSLEDILEEFNLSWDNNEEKVKFALDKAEEEVFSLIDNDGISFEEVLLRSKSERAAVNKALLTLQIKGLIEERKPLYYVRKSYG